MKSCSRPSHLFYIELAAVGMCARSRPNAKAWGHVAGTAGAALSHLIHLLLPWGGFTDHLHSTGMIYNVGEDHFFGDELGEIVDRPGGQ